MFMSAILQDIKKRPSAFMAMIFLVILGVALGRWQLRRADYKIHLATEIAEKGNAPILSANERDWTFESAGYRKMQAIGYWDVQQGVWLENRTHPLGKDPKTGINTGFNLLMPLKLEGPRNQLLWVNRGWVPRDFNQINHVPSIKTPTEKVIIEGIVFPDSGKTLQLSKEVENLASDGLTIKENLDLHIKPDVPNSPYLPFVLKQVSASMDGELDTTIQPYHSGVSTHYGYAFQWFALSVMTFLFWVITGYRKRLKSLR
jgi:cytochrome oxidase assembly protein ShyY1